MRNRGNYLLFVIVLILAALAFNTVEAQDGGDINFPGNVVLTGEFLKYYRSVPEHQLLFGNAISNEMDMNGKRVQYFDRVRFELTMTDKGPQVQLAPLGYFLYDETKTSSSEVPIISTNCRYFPKYGHKVCYSFLQFYDEHNGQVYFGSPVSEMITENGQFVQYFEYARFEYRYNMPADMKVGLTSLGLLSMKRNYGTAPMPYFNIGSLKSVEVTTIQARAFVSRALVAPGSTNTLYAVVQFPDYKGVADAKVNVSILIGDKATSLPVANTDEDGIAKIEIPAFDLAPQQTVELQVVVNYEEQSVKTSTWYRVWY